MIDILAVESKYSLAIVDSVTISPGAADVTADGSVVSLETGSSTLDIGTGRLALTPTVVENASGELVAFEGGQRRGLEVSLLLLFGIEEFLMTLMM